MQRGADPGRAAPRYNAPMIPDRVVAAVHARLADALALRQGRYRPLRVERAAAGWLDDARAARLAAMPDVFAVRDDGIAFVAGLDDAPARTRALERVARTLAADGLLTAWRDERYAVAPALRRATVVRARARGRALLRQSTPTPRTSTASCAAATKR